MKRQHNRGKAWFSAPRRIHTCLIPINDPAPHTHTIVDSASNSSYKPLSPSDSPVNQHARHIHTVQTQGNAHTPWASRGRLCVNGSSAMSESDDVAFFLSFVVSLLTRLPTHCALTHAQTRSGFDVVVWRYRLACDGVLLVARRRV